MEIYKSKMKKHLLYVFMPEKEHHSHTIVEMINKLQ